MQLKTLIPNAVCTAPKWENGFVDIGFQSAVETDKAALAIINLQPNRTLPITHNRFKEDRKLYNSFTKLPTTILRQELIAKLRNGLTKYGRIVDFEMEQDDLMPQCAMSKAIAIICPRDDIRQDKKLIQEKHSSLQVQIKFLMPLEFSTLSLKIMLPSVPIVMLLDICRQLAPKLLGDEKINE